MPPILSALMLAAALIGACAAPGPSAPGPPNASTASVSGRWDDLSGALTAAQRNHEMAVLTTSDPAENVRVVTLLTNLDERVLVRAERTSERSADNPGEIDLSVSFGLWGNAAKEAAIIQTIEQSLAAQDARRRSRGR